MSARMLRALRPGLLALPVLFLGVFFLLPLGAIIQRALFADGALASASLRALISNQHYLGVIWFSAWQAAVSTLLTLAAATPAAYVFARYSFPGKALLRSLAAVPFVLPTVVVALAFRSLIRALGIGNLDHSIWLVLLSHVFFNYTIVLRIVGGYWAAADPRLEEAAAVLGASRWRAWREVTLPLVLPALLAAALLVFMFTFAAFGTVLILGGPAYRTIEVEIYEQAVHLFNLPVAAALSLLQICATLAMTVLYTRLQRRAAVPQDVRLQAARRLLTWRKRLGAGAIICSQVALLLAPLLALAVSALRVEDSWSLHWFRALTLNERQSFFYVSPARIIGNSLLFASATTVLAIGLGVPASYLLARPRAGLSRWLDPLFMLPLGTSAVTLGFGYIIAFRSYHIQLGPLAWDTPDLRATPWVLPLAHTLLALPFVTRTMLPALRRLNPRLREAAAVLGAPPGRVLWEIDLPLLLPALVVAALFAFTVSMGDFGAALLLARPEYTTMPVAIYTLLGQQGRYGQALAMSTLLMLVTLASFAAIERLRGPAAEF